MGYPKLKTVGATYQCQPCGLTIKMTVEGEGKTDLDRVSAVPCSLCGAELEPVDIEVRPKSR